MAISLSDANQYFSERLNTGTWDNASDADKTKSLAQAEKQVNTLRLREDVPATAVAEATYEQALFLLSLTAYDQERQRAHALGVIGGSVGDANEYSSAEIVRNNRRRPPISPETLFILEDYLIKHRVGQLR